MVQFAGQKDAGEGFPVAVPGAIPVEIADNPFQWDPVEGVELIRDGLEAFDAFAEILAAIRKASKSIECRQSKKAVQAVKKAIQGRTPRTWASMKPVGPETIRSR